jgi:hypothetical protein
MSKGQITGMEAVEGLEDGVEFWKNVNGPYLVPDAPVPYHFPIL